MPSPTIVSPLTARTCIRHVVRLSGIVTSTPAMPSALVVIWAPQYAVFRKSWRARSMASPPPAAPPFEPCSASATTSFQRFAEIDIDDAVLTPIPRSNQKARNPSGPRSSWSDSTALSTTATETSDRTPAPVWSVTRMA